VTERVARVLLPAVASGTAGPKAAADVRADSSRQLEAIYRTHVEFVWRVVRRHGVPRDAIEDLVHEVFLVVRRRLTELDGRVECRGWLFMITRGVVSNDRRIRARRVRRHDEAPAPLPPPDPERFAEGAEAIAWTERFLSTLPEEQRLVFELVDIEGLTGPEVARLGDVGLDTLYSRLRLARAAFACFVAALREGRRP